ncbi:MAG: hypothetical protein KDJ27_05195 [Gammaproteobacteria bacterium]|nr:hypothetical protein [Gammaproteobacteria bacterium]MCB1923134.1 hypothetical protein [Gammaproteobacteria bacterium]
MNILNRWRLPLCLLLILGLAACVTNPFAEVPERLTMQLRKFESVVRWGALQKMSLFEKHAEGEVPTMQEGLENVRVTGYELANPLTKIEPLRWGQTVVIDYVLTDRQVVRQIIDHQIWESDDDGVTWYRTTPVPQFR